MASVIRYEYSASTQPPEPTESSTLYTGALSYPVGGGFYCAKKWDEGQTVVTRKSFDRLWTPANTTTALWLDANDLTTITKDGSNYVSEWNDKSGNGRNATATGTEKPLYSNSKMVFDGSDDMMQIANMAINTKVFVIMLLKNTDLSKPFFMEHSSDFNTSSNGFYIYGQTGASWANKRGGSHHLGNISANWMGTSETIIGFDYNIVGLSYKNGNVLTNTETFGSALANSSYTDTLYISSRAKFKGDFCELCILPANADTTLRQKFEGYLAHRWDGINGNTALVTALDISNPYKSSPPTA